MRRAVANAYAVVGDRPFDVLKSVYRAVSTDEDRVRVLSAMLSTPRVDEYAKVLDFLTSGEVKRQDIQLFIVGAGNPYVRDLNIKWLISNYKLFIEAYGDPGVLSRVFTYAIPMIGIGHEREVEDFLRSLNIPGVGMGVEAGLELLRVYSRVANSLGQ
jgi:hypothetical protein